MSQGYSPSTHQLQPRKTSSEQREWEYRQGAQVEICWEHHCFQPSVPTDLESWATPPDFPECTKRNFEYRYLFYKNSSPCNFHVSKSVNNSDGKFYSTKNGTKIWIWGFLLLVIFHHCTCSLSQGQSKGRQLVSASIDFWGLTSSEIRNWLRKVWNALLSSVMKHLFLTASGTW